MRNLTYKPQVTKNQVGGHSWWRAECKMCAWHTRFAHSWRAAFSQAERHANRSLHRQMLKIRMRIRDDLSGFPAAVQEHLDRDN